MTSAWAVVVAMMVGTEVPLVAQSSQPPASDRPAVTVRWDNGVSIASDDGDSELQIGGLVQFDGRFAPDDPLHQVTDTFVLRRVRPILQGRGGRYFEFRLMPDFGNGATAVYDAYVDMKLSKSFRIRFGKDKEPVGLEQLYSDYAILFPERSLATNLVPNRDVGIEARGSLGDAITFIGAVFNGVNDGENGDLDLNGAKDLVGRVTLRPFARSARPPFRGFGVALAGSRGTATGPLPSFKSTGQATFFSYAGTVTPNGERRRISPSSFYYYRSIAAYAEYVRSTQDIERSNIGADVTHRAWEITGAYVLTGEAAAERGVSPRHPFDRDAHHWGALQFAVRHSRLAVDPTVFATGLASTGSSRSASATGVSAIWYLNAYVKYVLAFERTVFDDDPHGPRRPEHAVIFRLQFSLQPML